MSSDRAALDDRPLLTLLSLATERERDRLVQSLVKQGYEDVGLAAVRMLARLADGPKSIQQLAALSAVSKQVAARTVQRLAEGGYVRVHSAREDKRRSEVSLDARGTALLAASSRAKRARDRSLATKLGGEALTALREALQRLIDDGP